MPEIVHPDEQARAEVSAYLNSPSLASVADLTARLAAAQGTVRLRGEEIEELVRERDEYARRLLHAVTATEDWQRLFENAIAVAWGWRGRWEAATLESEVAQELVGNWQQRALLLEAAVKTYASHAWNDIKRSLVKPNE